VEQESSGAGEQESRRAAGEPLVGAGEDDDAMGFGFNGKSRHHGLLL
jgi:hypothetical protein